MRISVTLLSEFSNGWIIFDGPERLFDNEFDCEKKLIFTIPAVAI